jgi:hypothetical protein
LALRRCVRVVLIARRGAGGTPPASHDAKDCPQDTCTKMAQFVFLEFSTEKDFVEKRFLNFYGDFWASVAPSVCAQAIPLFLCLRCRGGVSLIYPVNLPLYYRVD